MEHASFALIVITLLQLSRAEISEIIPGTWFSANAINDGYSPKPILDLFSTDPTPGFSPTQPIIVLPSQPPSQPDVEVTHLSTTPTFIPSSTSSPPTTTQSSYSTSFSSSSSPFPTSTSRTTSSFTSETSSTPFPPTTTAFTQSSSFFTPSVSNSPVSEPVSTPFPPPENFPIFNFPNSPQLQTTLSDSQGEGRALLPGGFNLVNAIPVPTIPPFQFPQTQTTAPPNYFVIYQNAPQAPQIQSMQPQTPVTTQNPTVTTPMNTNTPINTNTLSVGTSRPTVTFRSTPPTITTFKDQKRTTSPMMSLNPLTRVTIRPATSPIPPRVYPGPPKQPYQHNLKIRVVAPKGSITNVKINPTTTTKRPTTRKVKVKKNTYEGCVDNCKGKREPVCAIPLGTLIVDPDLLKGFPSICHMACHNSFKKDPYEMIVEGRCGRIRTRIIRVDSKTKIHREELKKSEYSIVNTGPKTVVEFAGGNIKRKD